MKYRIVSINTAAPKSPKSSILIVYTGGTIGMEEDETGALVSLKFNKILEKIPTLRSFDLQLTVISFPKPIDSSDININHWVDIGYIIYENYQQYDGFVILHGTDTMAFSASAISFILEGLNKPVIFTGAQLPVSAKRTDARENMITALEIASTKIDGHPAVPEVCIYFDYQLLRGNRAKKVQSLDFAAFESDNYPHLAEAGILIDYNFTEIKKFDPDRKLIFHNKFDTNVVILTLFPGISKITVESVLSIPGLKGVVLETYGSGNATTESWFINCLEEAIERGIIIYNVSQCSGGRVMQGRYMTSRILSSIGVLSGSDITTEAAVTKMMFLLGKESSINNVKQGLITSLAGEMT